MMIDNWGSTLFNITYLVIIWAWIVLALKNSPKEKTPQWKWTMAAFVILGFGDIFHLATRSYIFFIGLGVEDLVALYAEESTIQLMGFGLVMTSITVQIFYAAMYFYWRDGEIQKLEQLHESEEIVGDRLVIYDFTVILSILFRIALIFYPYNNWGHPSEGVNYFRYLTNLPLFVIGILVIYVFFKRSKEEEFEDIPGFSEGEKKMVKNAAIWYLVSYICYSLTLFLTPINSLFGMAMIPKTIAYLVALYYFYIGVLKQD